MVVKERHENGTDFSRTENQIIEHSNLSIGNEETGMRSSLEKYTTAAKNAEKMVFDREDAETVETWRKIVEAHGLEANREFLVLLNDRKVEEDVALAFMKATTFAVSVLTSYGAISQKSSWLMQLVEDLSDISRSAQHSPVAMILASAAKCRDDLIAYCSRNDHNALEDMANYVVLIERHRGIEANDLPPYFLILLRKFISDCTDYHLKQDVVGEAQRTDSDWVRLHEIGTTLAKWMQILRRAEVNCSNVDELLVSSHFREFEARFPGRLPAHLHEYVSRYRSSNQCMEIDSSNVQNCLGRSWCQFIGDAGNKTLDNYTRSLESQLQERTAGHLQRVATVDHISLQFSSKADGAISVSNAASPLEKFISSLQVAQDQLTIELANRTRACDVESNDEQLPLKWAAEIKECFRPACNDLCKRLASNELNEQLVTAFCEAIGFVVSLITVHISKCFQHSSVTEILKILCATYKQSKRSQFHVAFEPIREFRIELVHHCDKCCSNWFQGAADSIKDIGRVVSQKGDSIELQSAVLELGEQFRSICTHKIRQKYGKPLMWSEEVWRRFHDIGFVLSHWLKRVGQSLDDWKATMSKDLLKMSIKFPGKIPAPLLKYVSRSSY